MIPLSSVPMNRSGKSANALVTSSIKSCRTPRALLMRGPGEVRLVFLRESLFGVEESGEVCV